MRWLRREPGAGLYFAHFRYIDGEGKTQRSCRPLPARETATQYVAACSPPNGDTYGSGYLYRSPPLRPGRWHASLGKSIIRG